MSDETISRQAAIDAIKSVPEGNWKNKRYTNEIEKIPSAERRGRWIDLKCDQCGQVDMSKPNYCPNCGARMEAE